MIYYATRRKHSNGQCKGKGPNGNFVSTVVEKTNRQIDYTYEFRKQTIN